MSLVPGVTDVTKPVPSTVAMPGDAETHGVDPAGVPDPLNCVVDSIHRLRVPEIVGKALTVTVAIILQPLISV